MDMCIWKDKMHNKRTRPVTWGTSPPRARQHSAIACAGVAAVTPRVHSIPPVAHFLSSRQLAIATAHQAAAALIITRVHPCAAGAFFRLLRRRAVHDCCGPLPAKAAEDLAWVGAGAQVTSLALALCGKGKARATIRAH